MFTACQFCARFFVLKYLKSEKKLQNAKISSKTTIIDTLHATPYRSPGCQTRKNDINKSNVF